MEKIKKTVEYIKNNEFKRLIGELVLLTLLFNVNIYVGCFLAIIVLAEIIITKDNKNLLSSLIFLAFCDDILIIPWLHCSVSRIILIAVFIKLLIDIIKNKRIPNKFQIAIAAFFTISSIVEIITIGASVELLATYINILTFVGFSMVFNYKDNTEIEEFIEKLCYAIVAGLTCSIVYGFITLNFMKYIQGGKVIYRFNGTIEPNFMCLFIDVGIFALLTVKEKINRKIFYILLALYLCSAYWTSSVTGIGILAVSLFIYLILFRKQWKKILKEFAIGIVIAALVVTFARVTKIGNLIEGKEISNQIDMAYLKREGSKNNSNDINTRLGQIIELLKKGDFDEMTSGRTAIARSFISASFNRPVFNILLGNGPNNSMVYCELFLGDCVCHNTYIDFLYNFGIIGFIISTAFVIYKTIKNVYLNTKITDNKYCKNIKIIRITILLYSLALTLYTRRMLLVFFLL